MQNGTAFEFEAPFVLGAQIEARARHPEVRERVFLVHDDRSWTYRQYRDESVRFSHFLRQRLGALDDRQPGHVAILMENRLELLGIYGACGFGGLTLFGINTGLRGETLAGVLNQSRARVLICDAAFAERVEAIGDRLESIPEENRLIYTPPGLEAPIGDRDWSSCVAAEVGPEGKSLEAPAVDVSPDQNLMVIYTSGTTGLPKGINNNHFKLLAIGRAVSQRLGLGCEDRGYACMPLFHSNALFLGLQPAFAVGASVAIRERFSASRFLDDVLEHGVTYWNYVGEPVHYILGALEKAHGPEPQQIRKYVAGDARNRFRYAIGNGASPPDIDRFIDWWGLEDMFELYGSTEAAISTFRCKTDPRGSVGRIDDDAVQILDPDGRQRAPAILGPEGKLENYAEAVGEICRVAPDTSLFQGYFDNDAANDAKFREGVYYSGDLGHIRVIDGARYLYFDGRTDDWIRKDGENFSAAQVARLVQEHPDVVLAAAYGVPCVVSDELVMVSLKLRPGAIFDPQAFFDFCREAIAGGGMDPKWFPDFVRVVDEFVYTKTQKILVRNLKAEHFDRSRLVAADLYWRRRESTCFEIFETGHYERLLRDFEAAERVGLLGL